MKLMPNDKFFLLMFLAALALAAEFFILFVILR
jgi:hypothetical protein